MDSSKRVGTAGPTAAAGRRGLCEAAYFGMYKDCVELPMLRQTAAGAARECNKGRVVLVADRGDQGRARRPRSIALRACVNLQLRELFPDYGRNPTLASSLAREGREGATAAITAAGPP